MYWRRPSRGRHGARQGREAAPFAPGCDFLPPDGYPAPGSGNDAPGAIWGVSGKCFLFETIGGKTLTAKTGYMNNFPHVDTLGLFLIQLPAGLRKQVAAGEGKGPRVSTCVRIP